MVSARFLLGLVAAASVGLASVPAAAQLSDSTQFLKAVKERDGAKATALIATNSSLVINSRGDNGEGALHILVKERDLTWIAYLLGKGARADLQDRAGMTPLALAAQIGWVEGADRLLRGGAKVDLPNNQGETPLILAVQNRDLATARLLLSRGADPNRPDNLSGQSALDYARQDGRATAMVKLLESRPSAPANVQGPKL